MSFLYNQSIFENSILKKKRNMTFKNLWLYAKNYMFINKMNTMKMINLN